MYPSDTGVRYIPYLEIGSGYLLQNNPQCKGKDAVVVLCACIYMHTHTHTHTLIHSRVLLIYVFY